MFEILYKDPVTIAKYRLAPLLEERERYLRVVVASGAVGDIVRRVARAQLLLIKLLNLPDADIPVRLATAETAVQEWRRNVPEVSAADFRRHGFRWLRFLGWLEEPVLDAHPHARQVEAFGTWMRDDRGLSEATVGNCCYESDRFFAWAAGRYLMLADITVGDIDEYLAARIADGGLRRTTARAAAGRLRSFFRFAETRSWCRPGIAGCIMPPLAYPDRPVPKGFDRDEVEKLLATTEGSTPADCRDRAVLMILATCGLRAGEVGALRVDDIDWERDMLRVFRPKTGRADLFPLTPSVGNALGIRAIPLKKTVRPRIAWLSAENMDTMIAGPDRRTVAGRVEHALLLFLYNSGARASETAGLRVEDLHLPERTGENARATIHGKGGKIRITPIWTSTAKALAALSGDRPPGCGSVFWSRHRKPYTRHGIIELVERAAARVPELTGQKITPHVLRHSCACHLLRSGVDINTIRAWLGHVSLVTTNIYAEVDLKAKEEAMKSTCPGDVGDEPRWKARGGLLEQLKAI